MARYATAFREYEPDQAPSDFTRQWGTAYDALVRHSQVDLEARLELADASESERLHSWDLVAADADRDDVEVLCLVASPNVTASHTVSRVVVLRASGADGTENGYYLELLHTTDQVRVGRYVSGTSTAIDTQAAAASTLRIGSLVWIRFRVNSTTLQARVWDHDATEPTTWDIDTTDANVSGVGDVGLISDEPLACWFFGVGTDGDTAPGKEYLGPSLAELALDPDASIEFVAEISSRDPATDVESTRYYSTHPRKTDGSDLPVDQDYESLLVSIGEASAAIQGDFDRLGGRAVDHGDLELNNEPAEPGEARPFSNAETYIGRRSRLRVGKAGSPIRGFTVLRTSEAERELDVTEDRARLRLRSALGRLLDSTIAARRHVGIPTCLSTLIANNARITVPAHSRYDLTEFTLMCRIRHATGNVEISQKEASSTDRNWRFYTASGRLFCEFSISGTNTVIHSSSTTETVDDSQWHDLVWGFQAERSYLMLDENVLSDIEPTGVPDTQAGAQGPRWQGFSGVGDQIVDCRILGTFLDPDTARAQFSQRSEADDPNLVGLWRADDGSGTTATDYSDNANHGTVNGVEDTGFAWVASDLGDINLAGQRMPVAYGVGVNFPMPLIDFLRERYRLNDRALDGALDFGDEATVRTQGVEVVETTDWTDEGDGVIEMVDATLEPVNAGLDPETGVSTYQAPVLIQRVLTERCGWASTDFDARALEGLRRAAPIDVGYHAFSEQKAEEVVRRVLSPLGAHYFEDRFGRLTGGLLLETVPPGPISSRSLELRGLEESRIFLGGFTTGASIHGLAAWIFPLGELRDPSTTAASTPAGQTIIELGGGSRLAIDESDGALVGHRGSEVARAPLGTLVPGVWNFVYLDWEGVGAPPTSRLYHGLEGGSVREVASVVNTSTTVNSSHVSIGNRFVGAIQNAQVYNGAKTEAEIQDIMDDGTDSGLAVDFALDEGEGLTVTEGVSGDQVVQLGGRWIPMLELDLGKGNQGISVDSFRRLAPVDKVTLRYGPNFGPMADADFVASATDDDRGLLKRAFTDVSTRDPDASEDYGETRDVELESLMLNRTQAQERHRLLRTRLSPDRYVAEITGLDRRALELQVGDVVRLVDDWHPELVAGYHGRLASLRAGKSWSLDLWG